MKEVGQKKVYIGTPLAVQWLGLHASTARGTGSIPAQRTKILHAVQCSQKKKKESMLYNSVYRKSQKMQTLS